MTTTGAPAFSSDPPHWPHCAHGAEPASDPSGCRGRQVEPYGACLAHLTDRDQAAYLTVLEPGSDIDHRGTPITESLLQQLPRCAVALPGRPG